MRRLVWFRTDLRTTDNTALAAARRSGDGVVGLFVVSPGEWRDHGFAPAKIDLWLRAVTALRDDLATLGIPLRVTTAKQQKNIPAAILSIAREIGAGEIHFNREYELDERRRDDAVISSAAKAGIAAHAHDDQCIVAPGLVCTGEGKPFSVYTPFRNRWGAVLEDTDATKTTGAPKPQPDTGINPDAIPTAADVGFDSPIDLALWPAGEREARRRLRAFVKSSLPCYATQRDRPDLDGTSSLSPYLALGMISARECARAAATSRAQGAARWLDELAWRDFYIHVTDAFPRIVTGRAFRAGFDRIRWRDDDEAFDRWTQGRTGVPIVDAGMRQLLATGWMHNRVRMIAAMYLCKDLLIDWRRGEAWFMSHLVDGFFASNNGGWQWSASTGTDAAPYFRIFNPTLQSRKADPKGEYIRRWVPELASLGAKDIHDPPPLARASVDYPAPIVDHKTARDRAITAYGAAAK